MRWFPRSLPTLVLAGALGAQATDVGLTMSGGALTVQYGQSCGPVTCTPFPGGTMQPGDTRTVTHHAPQNTPYVLAIGFPGPCFPFPGIDNSVLLAVPPVTLAIGSASLPALTAACRQAQARYQFTLPAAAPGGIVFRLQSLGQSGTGALAFGPAIEVTVQ
jgi:hypothetical protein